MKFPVLATALSLLVAGAAQAVPDVVSYAARVENDAGLFSGTVSATFQLFGAPTGGTELWSENAASIVVIGGDLVHDLGSIEPLDDTVLARDDLFLQVTINGDVLEPRAAIRAVPFALLAKNAEVAARAVVADSADRLGGQSLSSFQFTAGANGGLALAGTAFSIAPNGVTADRIAAAAVSLAKMAANSVDASKIVDGAVSLAKLAANSVDGSKIVDGAVSLAKLAANSIDGSKIVDGSVAGVDIQGSAITSVKIATGAVGTTQILDGSVATADLATNAVTGAKLSGDAVSSVHIVNGSITNNDLGLNSVTADKINGNLIALFSRPAGCGGGLQVGADACTTLACNETVDRDAFGTILDVDVTFMNCAGVCSSSNTSEDSCAVTAAGNLLPTTF